MIKQENNEKNGRFVIYDNNQEAGEMTYVWAGDDKFIIDHTNVDEKYSGKGYAKQLVMAAVEYARENQLKIIPLCPYAKSRFEKDSSIHDVLAS